MKCGLCHETKEGLSWIGNADGRLAVCKDCLDELVANQRKQETTDEAEPQTEIA